MTTYQSIDEPSEMSDATSRYQWKRPSRGAGSESAASIPPAPMASVARLAALTAKIDAYNRRHAGGDGFMAQVRLGRCPETKGGIN
jgi:hypothetical protein